MIGAHVCNGYGSMTDASGVDTDKMRFVARKIRAPPVCNDLHANVLVLV